MVMLFQIAL